MMRISVLFAAALALATVNLAQRKESFGQTEDSVLATFQQGRQLQDQGKVQSSLPYLEKAAVEAPKVFGPTHSQTLAIYNSLAVVYHELGDYPRAEAWQKPVLEMRERTLGKDHLDVAASLNNLGNIYLRTGEWDKAEAAYRRALSIRELRLGKNHPDVADALNNLSLLLTQQGKYFQAEALSRRSLSIKEAQLGSSHPLVATSLNNLGVLYAYLGQFEAAKSNYRRGMAILEKRFGATHPHVADSLSGLAGIAQEEGRTEEAVELYRRALGLRESALGKDHPEVAQVLERLARSLLNLERPEEAKPLLQRCLAIREQKLGKEHGEVGSTLSTFARLHAAQGKYHEARDCAERGLVILRKCYGADNELTLRTLGELITVEVLEEDFAAAEERFDDLRRRTRRFLASQLPALNPADQLRFLRDENEKTLHLAMVLGWRLRDQNRSRARSASWLLNGKGLAQEALAEQALEERNLADPALKAAAVELRDLRRMLATVATNVTVGDKRQERDQFVAEIVARQQELELKLQTSRRGVTGEPWVELADLDQAIPAGSAFCDFLRLDTGGLWEEAAENAHPERYVAWVHVGGNSGVQILDLGEARVIDAAIQTVRERLAATQTSDPERNPLLKEGEVAAESQLKAALSELSRRVLAPLIAEVGQAKELVLSPDSALWLVPWSALPLEDGRYAVEEYVVRYVVSGRDLLPARATEKQEAPKIFADPDYDLNVTSARQYVGKLTLPAPQSSELRGQRDPHELPKVNRLPGTAVEAQMIAPVIERHLGRKPLVYQAGYALEAAVKQSHSPQLLVLATHGYFFASPKRPGSRQESSGRSDVLENPLLRCGLLLAGCNDRTPRAENEEDGVLTGLEAAGCDLRNTEMVVLSACETGLGDLQQGEGIAGLRQAFQLAGARAVVATLWQVPDRETALLMGQFFEGLAEGKSRSAALRSAQLQSIRSRREKHGAAHPLYWAAWTMTGG